MPQHTVDALTQALEAAARAFIASLDGGTKPTVTAPRSLDDGTPIKFDPLYDEPPLPFKVKGTHEESLMSTVIYLGAIGRINGEKRRGANAQEVSTYAKKAGYSRGNDVNGWNLRKGVSREGSAITVVDGLRYLHAGTHEWVRDLASQLNIEIVGDFTPLQIPATS
ncbi:MAG: hypothetical protein NTX33_05340 [Propionibacteriales bacterium]|nr:hypothetical protein [Propionibacteriales bacterium]